MKKKIGLLSVLAVLACLGCIFFVMLNNEKKEVTNLVFENVNMSDVEDGTYEGEVSTALVSAKVRVTVRDKRIENIEILKHDNGLGSKAESIVDEMIKRNTYDVDVVSGATYSSKVIENAVNQALVKGKQH